jgi:competence protein ComEA
MFTGLTRQEQRTLLLLLAIVVAGVAVHQWRGSRTPAVLVIDAETGETLSAPMAPVSPSVAASPAAPETGPDPAAAASLIDLNTASVTELTALPGIGESRARAIVAHREANGPFASVQAITAVGGIGEGILARIRPLVSVSLSSSPSAPVGAGVLGEPAAPTIARQPAAPPPSVTRPPAAAGGLVNVNTAGVDELMSLPGIGEVLAQRIVEHRRSQGPFRRPEDLEAVHRIGPLTVERLRPLITF